MNELTNCRLALGPKISVAAIAMSAGLLSMSADVFGATSDDISAEKLVRITTAADVQAVGPGQSFHVAFIFDIEPHWHISWKNPGEGAPSPTIAITAPPGFVVGKTLWPRPSVTGSDVGELFIYETQTVLLVQVTAPAALTGSQARFEAAVRYAVCKDICLMGSAKQTITLPISPDAGAASANPAISKFLARLPQPLLPREGARVDYSNGTLKVTGPAGGHAAVKFFPDPTPGVTYGAAKSDVSNDRFTITVPVEVDANNSLGEPMALAGLIALGGELDDPCYDFSVPLAAATAP